jgi:outer membrane protein TolC
MMILWLVLSAWAAPIAPDAVVAAALQLSPDVASAEAAVDRAEAGLAAARGLRANPTLDVRLGFGLPQHEVSLSQPVSLSGEGLAAAAAAEASLRAAEATAARVRLQVAADARRALVSAIVADATQVLAEELLTLTTTLRAATEARRAAGEASDLDVQLARLDEAGATADVVASARVAQEARATLGRLTGLPWTVELPPDADAALPAPMAPVERRSDLVAAETAVEAAEAAVRRERAAILPPVEIGVWAVVQNVGVYASPSGVVIPRGDAQANTAWTVGPSLTMTLPVFKTNPAGRGEAAAHAALAVAGARAAQAAAEVDAARAADQRALIARVRALPDPSVDARAALAGLTAAVTAGDMSPADAALVRARVMDAWRRSIGARTPALEATLDLALAEEWGTLLPTGSP